MNNHYDSFSSLFRKFKTKNEKLKKKYQDLLQLPVDLRCKGVNVSAKPNYAIKKTCC